MKADIETDMSACPKFVDALYDNTATAQIYHALTRGRWCKARDPQADDTTQAVQILSLDHNDPERCFNFADDEVGHMFVRLRYRHHEIYNDYYDWFAHYAIIEAATPEIFQMFHDIGWVQVPRHR